MLKKDNGSQQKMFFGRIEDLMPKEHFLRDLDRLLDFSFIYEKVESLYSNPRRRIVPIALTKMNVAEKMKMSEWLSVICTMRLVKSRQRT